MFLWELSGWWECLQNDDVFNLWFFIYQLEMERILPLPLCPDTGSCPGPPNSLGRWDIPGLPYSSVIQAISPWSQCSLSCAVVWGRPQSKRWEAEHKGWIWFRPSWRTEWGNSREEPYRPPQYCWVLLNIFIGMLHVGPPRWHSGKETSLLQGMQETRIRSLGGEDPPEKKMATHSSILAGKFHGQRSLVGYSPWGCKESDTTEATEHTPHTMG